MGEIDKAKAKLAVEQETKRIKREATTVALNEKIAALIAEEDEVFREMRAHADLCSTCATPYVRSGVLAYELCTVADTLGCRADALYQEKQIAWKRARVEEEE